MCMKKRRVLVIEDNGLIALDLRDTLERAGLEVVGVANNVGMPFVSPKIPGPMWRSLMFI